MAGMFLFLGAFICYAIFYAMRKPHTPDIHVDDSDFTKQLKTEAAQRITARSRKKSIIPLIFAIFFTVMFIWDLSEPYKAKPVKSTYTQEQYNNAKDDVIREDFEYYNK